MELYNKYRPKTVEEILGNDVSIKSIKKELENGSHVFLLTGPGGCGKAQPVDTIIPTPNGYRKFGELKIGDVVYGRNGTPIKVIGVYDRGLLDAYEVTLSDGRKTICNDDHLWSVFTSKNNLIVKSLREMIDSGIAKTDDKGHISHKFSIPVNNEIEMPDNDLQIDPYVIGSFIGNGCNKSKYLSLSSNDEFNVSECAKLIDGLCHKNSDFNYTWTFKTKNNELIKTDDFFKKYKSELCCYSHEKRIPNDYKYTTIENRYKLLQGLFDTDGSVSSCYRNNVSYTTTSELLKNDLIEVLQSLGISSTVTIDNRLKTDDCHICYRISVKISNGNKHLLFRTPKKLLKLSGNNHITKKRYDRVQIVSAEKLNEKLQMRCIKVDAEDELYLTNDFIVTHNTTTARVFANVLGANEMSIHEINSSENRGIDTVREIMEQVRYAPLDGGKMVYILDEIHQQTSASQNALLKVLEECPEHCFFFLATTNPEKLIQPLKTRCSIVNLKPLDHNTMFMLLRKVAHKEGVSINQDILHKIADLSNGSSRQGLKILSQIISLETDEERNKFLDNNVFNDDKPEVIELCRALFKQEGWSKYMECMENLKDELSSNAEGIRQAIMGYAYSILKKNCNPVAIAMIQTFSNTDCYKNGKNGIMVGILDFLDFLQGE